MKNYSESFRERLKYLRSQRKLTQQQLGVFVDAGKQVVNNWEAGRNMPTLAVACTLADALGVSLDYLVGRSDDPEMPKTKAPGD